MKSVNHNNFGMKSFLVQHVFNIILFLNSNAIFLTSHLPSKP